MALHRTISRSIFVHSLDPYFSIFFNIYFEINSNIQFWFHGYLVTWHGTVGSQSYDFFATYRSHPLPCFKSTPFRSQTDVSPRFGKNSFLPHLDGQTREASRALYRFHRYTASRYVVHGRDDDPCVTHSLVTLGSDIMQGIVPRLLY